MISGIASITSYSDLLFVFYTVLRHKVFGRIGRIAVFVADSCPTFSHACIYEGVFIGG